MAKTNLQYALDDEDIIMPYKEGVQIIRPQRSRQPKSCGFSIGDYSIKQSFKAPCNMYLLDRNSVALKINKQTANTHGYYSIEEGLHKSIFDVTDHKSATKVRSTHIEVINKRKIIITEKRISCNNGLDSTFLTMEFPWFNKEGVVMGLLGCSICLGIQPLSQSLLHITKLGLLREPTFISEEKQLLLNLQNIGIGLSHRELQCAHLMVRGKNAKTIAKMLSLSPRTIEHHIDNIKIKLNVTSKYQAVEKIIEYIHITA